MTLSTIKNSLGMALVMAVLAGCSSNDTMNENSGSEQAGGSEATTDTGTANNDGLNGGDNTNSNQDMYAELDRVFYFDFDKSVLRPESRAALIAHAKRIKEGDNSVRLEGHADDRGTREYNMALGERRAQAVRDFLQLQGVNSSQMEVISYGEERPEVDGTSESARQQNRRVEMVN